jgi:hypothetical protein
MNNIHDPHNIIGMADILADDDEDLDINAIEKSITQGITFVEKKHVKPIDMSKEYNDDLEQISRQFNIGSFSGKSPDLNDNEDNSDPNLLDWSPYDKKNTVSSQYSSYADSEKNDIVNKNTNFSLQEDDDNDSDSGSGNDNDRLEHKRTPNRDYHSNDRDDDNKNIHPSWNYEKGIGSQLNYMTNEERKQSHIHNVLGNMKKTDQDNHFIEQEDEEDEMARILEQVDLLKTNLESEGVNLDRIPDVDSKTSRKEAKGVLKILQIKNDRLRYCDMFEEGILACAYGLEGMFDGKKSWFGTKVDLIGWSDTVKVKLRRMRYDTSSFVSDVMKGYAIGHGWRIVFELLPSLFLYSRDRRLHHNDNLISDASYKDAINNLGTT